MYAFLDKTQILVVNIPFIIAVLFVVVILLRSVKQTNKGNAITKTLAVIGLIMVVIYFTNLILMLSSVNTITTASEPANLEKAKQGYYYNLTMIIESPFHNICPYRQNLTPSNTVKILVNLRNVNLSKCTSRLVVDSYNPPALLSVVSQLNSIFKYNIRIINVSRDESLLKDELYYKGTKIGVIYLTSKVQPNPNVDKNLYERVENLELINPIIVTAVYFIAIIVGSIHEVESPIGLIGILTLLALIIISAFGTVYLLLPPKSNTMFNNIELEKTSGYVITGDTANNNVVLSDVMGDRPIYVVLNQKQNYLYIGENTTLHA